MSARIIWQLVIQKHHYLLVDIWILGDSIPYWAGNHARQQCRPNLKLKKTVAWWCGRGCGWEDFDALVGANFLLSKAPEVIVLHMGGNDICKKSILRIKNLIKEKINKIKSVYPDVQLVWVDILQRQKWGNYEHKTAEKCRVRLNRLGRTIVPSQPSLVLRMDITSKEGFFRSDGVHLNVLGLEYYLDSLKDVLEMALAK